MQRFASIGIRGCSCQDDAHDRELLEPCLRAAMIAKTGTQVHAEVKILSYLDQYGLTGAMINISDKKTLLPGLRCTHPFLQTSSNSGPREPWQMVSVPVQVLDPTNVPTTEQVLWVREEILEDFVEDWGEQRRRRMSITPGNQSDNSGFPTTSELENDERMVTEAEKEGWLSEQRKKFR